MKLKIALLCTLLYAGSGAFAQELTVTGRVTNASNEPLSGVTVSIPGTQKTVVTNADGTYTISVPRAGTTLHLTYVGMEARDVLVPSSGPLNVSLTSAAGTMNEVVVVGYGQQKRAKVTGAISTINASQLQNVSNTRIEQTLQGRVSGVTVLPTSGQPGAGLSVRIRGTSSNRDNEPLYIVDGVRMGGMESIDPSDIATINILKDAASAAIYGAEGANGVVLITTKSGRPNQAGTISYTGQYTNQSIKKDFIKMMNAQQYTQYLQEAGVANAPTFADVANMGDGTNWLDQTLQTAPQQHHTLAFSGGTDRSSYYLSGGLLSADGIAGGSKAKFNRYTLRMNYENRVKNWLNVGVRLGYVNHHRKAISENNEFGSILASALLMDPTTPVRYTDANNLPAHVQTAISQGKPLLRDANGNIYGISAYLKGEYGNPIARIENQHGENIQHKITGNGFIDIEPIKGLKFTSRFGMDVAFQDGHGWTPKFYFSDESQNTIANGYDYTDRWTMGQLENFVTYNHRFGGHNLTALVGQSMQKWHEIHSGGSYSGLFKEEERFSYASFVPDDQDRIYSYPVDYSLASFFGRINYDYDGRYLFVASLRRDGSSKVADGHQWKTYPAFQAGWNFTQERFFPERARRVLTSGKLRGSWGQNGNVRSVGVGEWQNKIVTTGPYYDPTGNPLQGAAPGSLENPELTWETGEQFDIGTDLAFFDNRLSVTVDYYKRTTKDLLTVGSVPFYIGNNISTVNAGSVTNKGWDFDVTWRQPARTKGAFSWEIGANMSTVNNEVTELDPNNKIGFGTNIGTSWTRATLMEVGYPIWYFSGYQTAGIFQTQAQINDYLLKNNITSYTPAPKPGDPIFVDRNHDGILNDDDKTKIGSPHPDFVFGAHLNLSYKGFDLSVLAQGQSGNEIIMGFNRTDRPTANKPLFFYNNRWTGEGSTNDWFRADAGNDKIYSSDLMVFDGSFVRIRQLQLGYTLPASLLNRARMSTFRVYVSLDDFFTFTKYPGVDPESGNNLGNSIGIDRGGYPIPRKATIGLNLSF
ncbi:MAG: TonB-dependent receptor [Chitinophagaceae bacterium]|nr:MAG: TonB-dependent receptor [Chitinophagaceae bacterium]